MPTDDQSRGLRQTCALLAAGLLQHALQQLARDRPHLPAGDHSRWLREAIKEWDLAHEAADAEASPQADAAASRERIRAAIERHYTDPASNQ